MSWALDRRWRRLSGARSTALAAVVAALDEAFDGRRSFDEAMADYQQARDRRVRPIYEFTTQLATLDPPPPEMQQLLGATQGSQAAMDAFVSVIAGTMSPVDFLHPDHVATILNGAAA